MKKGELSRYLIYALGEVFLVVVGILIALQVNNWNEQRKANNERNELIIALISDFESSQKELEELVTASDSLLKMNKQLMDILNTNPIPDSPDSIRMLFRYFLIGTSFHPNHPAYKAAQSNDKLKLIGSDSLLGFLGLFEKNLEDLRDHSKVSDQNFYIGALYDLRKNAGSLISLREKNKARRLNFTDVELLQFFSQKETFASLETTITLNGVMNFFLHRLQENNKDILRELNRLKEQNR